MQWKGTIARFKSVVRLELAHPPRATAMQTHPHPHLSQKATLSI